MPKIENWSTLPHAIQQHLIERMRDRKITVGDLNRLRSWIDSNPEVPEGEWYKDFGSFKLAVTARFQKHSCCEDKWLKESPSDHRRIAEVFTHFPPKRILLRSLNQSRRTRSQCWLRRIDRGAPFDADHSGVNCADTKSSAGAVRCLPDKSVIAAVGRERKFNIWRDRLVTHLVPCPVLPIQTTAVTK